MRLKTENLIPIILVDRMLAEFAKNDNILLIQKITFDQLFLFYLFLKSIKHHDVCIDQQILCNFQSAKNSFPCNFLSKHFLL